MNVDVPEQDLAVGMTAQEPAEEADSEPVESTHERTVAGTVESTIDDDFDDDYEEATCAERVLDVCVRAIVDSTEDVEIEAVETNRRVILHVRVAPEDMGKIIGKRGRVANALRTLVKAAGARDGISAQVEIED
jgi:predicted RNA-binding protein YlqC (UPF0109 family)